MRVDGHHTVDSDDVHARVEERFRSMAQRYTRGRRRLVQTLLDAGRPLSQPEILDLEPDLAQSTVYRNLDALESSGLLRRIDVGADHARFELSERLQGHHHHLVCVDCGHVEDIRLDDRFERLVEVELSNAATESGFDPMYHVVDLHGRCATCTQDR